MTTIKREFNSFTHLARFIEQTPQVTTNQSSTTAGAEQSWDFGLGKEGAIELAKAGGNWVEGAEQMKEAKVEVDAVKSEGKVAAEDYDVTGYVVDVPAYLAGQPDCFLNEGEEDEDRKPVIVIGVHVGRRSDVKANSALWRGAAILSVIDDLEGKGYRCELWAIWKNKKQGVDLGVDFRIKIKDASEHWSPASVAFALCHPATNRRLMWHVAETHNQLDDFCGGYGVGHGRPDDVDIWFPWQGSNIYSPEAALREVTETFNNEMRGK